MTQVHAKTSLLVSGMRSNSCRETLSELLSRVEGVQDVDVNLIRGRVVVEHSPSCESAQLVWTIVNAGYAVSLENVE